MFLTGAAGLIYQVVWQQYLARILGSEHAATAIVLAIFLGGLATGYLDQRRAQPLRPEFVRDLAILEGIIGVWALLFRGSSVVWIISPPAGRSRRRGS